MFCKSLFGLLSFFFWPLCCLFFFHLRILITPLVSFGHCVVCSSSIYGFWLPFWYLLAIVLSVLLRFPASDYPLVFLGHCVVCSSSIYGFWLPLWYLLVIVLSVLRFTASGYPFGIFWSLCCLSFLDLPLLITLLVMCCLSFLDLRLLITPFVSFGHCVVCPSSIYGFWLPLWYLLVIVLSVLRFTASGYPFGIFWSLCCLSFDLRLLITPLVSFGHCLVCP
jgi:hypothetical protein